MGCHLESKIVIRVTVHACRKAEGYAAPDSYSWVLAELQATHPCSVPCPLKFPLQYRIRWKINMICHTCRSEQCDKVPACLPEHSSQGCMLLEVA